MTNILNQIASPAALEMLQSAASNIVKSLGTANDAQKHVLIQQHAVLHVVVGAGIVTVGMLIQRHMDNQKASPHQEKVEIIDIFQD